MIYKEQKPTVHIVRDLLTEFQNTLVGVIDLFIDNGGNSYTVINSYTGHLREKSVVTINGNAMTITSVDRGVSFTGTTATPPIVGDIYALPNFNYFYDTLIGQNDQLTKIEGISNKFPMIWLYEVFKEEHNTDGESPVLRNSPLKFYFLDNSNFTDWFVSDHYDNSIIPMENLAAAFVEFLINNGTIGKINNYSIISHKNFGTFVENGHINNWFNEHSSGVELSITLPIKSNCP